jgi:hypothetical protein
VTAPDVPLANRIVEVIAELSEPDQYVRGRYRYASGCVALQAATAGEFGALRQLAELREDVEDWDGAQTLYQQAADAGDTDVLFPLAYLRERAGDLEGAETLYRQCADAGKTLALTGLANLQQQAGNGAGAELLRRYGLNPDGTPAAPWPTP